MSLLPRGGARSDTALNVYGCSVCHFAERREEVDVAAAASAAFHVRLPGSQGAQLGVLLQQLLASSKFQHDLLRKGRMTVDDSSTGMAFAIHCLVSDDSLAILAITKPEYPTRAIFPGPTSAGGTTLLGALSRLTSTELGAQVFSTGAGMGGTVRRVQLAPKVVQQLERVCADFEDIGAHDKVARVQADVDDVRGVMQDNISRMIDNQEQLTSLQGKTDDIANASRGFFQESRSHRRALQCENFKMRLLAGGVITIIILFLFRGWIFGGGSDDSELCDGALCDVSPPPPALSAYY